MELHAPHGILSQHLVANMAVEEMTSSHYEGAFCAEGTGQRLGMSLASRRSQSLGGKLASRGSEDTWDRAAESAAAASTATTGLPPPGQPSKYKLTSLSSRHVLASRQCMSLPYGSNPRNRLRLCCRSTINAYIVISAGIPPRRQVERARSDQMQPWAAQVSSPMH